MIKKIPGSKVEFSVSVPWEKWKKYLDVSASEISEEIKIPGFRPGKAPREVVAQKVGKEMILNHATEKGVNEGYKAFVTEQKIEPIGYPEVEIKKVEEGKPIEFTAKVAVMPEVSLNEKYREEIIKINQESKEKKPEVKEEDIKLELDRIANSRVKLVTVRRPAQKEDSVEIDFTVKMNNVPIENGTSKNHNMIIGRGVFIPGFEDHLIGMNEGEEKNFELTFPESYFKKDLAGKVATFEVKMNLVQERQTPEMNDELAKSLGQFENLEALKKSIREGLEKEQEEAIKEERRAKYLDVLIESSPIELPEVLIHEETHRMFHEFADQIQGMGLTLEQYLDQIKKDRKELEKDWHEPAEKRVKSTLLLDKVAEKEKIEPSAEEIEGRMNEVLKYYKNVKDFEKNVGTERLYNYVKGTLKNEKVFEFFGKLD